MPEGTSACNCGISADNAIDGFDDVCAGLAEDDQHNGGFPIGQAAGVNVLDRIDHFGHVAQTHRRSVAERDDHRLIFLRLKQLIAGGDHERAIVVLNRSLGVVGVGGGQDCSHVFQAQAEVIELGRIHLNAHGGQRAAADRHLADPIHL